MTHAVSVLAFFAATLACSNTSYSTKEERDDIRGLLATADVGSRIVLGKQPIVSTKNIAINLTIHMANIMFNFAKFNKTLTRLIVEFANICQHDIYQILQVFSGICQKLTKLSTSVSILTSP